MRTKEKGKRRGDVAQKFALSFLAKIVFNAVEDTLRGFHDAFFGI